MQRLLWTKLLVLGGLLAVLAILAVPPADATPATPATSAELYSVDCVTSNDCIGVGEWHYVTSADTSTLAEAWNGAGWKVQSIPNPASSGGNLLYDVACPGSKVCFSVGVNFSSDTPILEQWNGTKWVLDTVKLPARATNGYLYSVACGSTTSCMAGGFYETLTKTDLAYALHWNGHSWSGSAAKNPSPTFDDLQAMSCPSATSCTAVGEQTNSSKLNVTLGERWNGSTWSVEPTPSAASGSSLLAGLACQKVTCLAVGYSTDLGNEQNLAATWNGTKWSNVSVPDPSPRAWNHLLSVSCASSSSCQAVGALDSATVETESMAFSWNGKSFTLETTPTAGSVGYALSGVSCTAKTSCMAVGWSQATVGGAAVAESWNGSTWTLLHMPNP